MPEWWAQLWTEGELIHAYDIHPEGSEFARMEREIAQIEALEKDLLGVIPGWVSYRIRFKVLLPDDSKKCPKIRYVSL